MEKINSILKSYRLFFLSVTIFLFLIIISLFNEFFDLPHVLFGFMATPVNIPELLFETTSLIVFGIVINWIILSSIKQHLKNREIILASLAEKESLLKEIHHRIKNNLALIVGIIRLQGYSVSDERLKNILMNLENRITSIALIHEKIYLSNDLNTVNLSHYFTDLIAEILTLSDKKIDVQLHIDPINLDQKNLIPIALITNELVINSIKHAFADEASPKLWISFKELESGYSLIVGNNGAKLPKDFSIGQTSSLGLTIVNSLITQISGQLFIVTTPNTEIQIQVPVDLNKTA